MVPGHQTGRVHWQRADLRVTVRVRSARPRADSVFVRPSDRVYSGRCPEASGITVDLVSTVVTLMADRVFDVFGDHSYRMDLRG
jgi:hypothetical protein